MMVDEYVNGNPLVKWCPATDCTDAVRVEDGFEVGGMRIEVQCSNGHQWCFSCQDEWHAPAMCDDVKKWRKKFLDDSETCNWLHANTRDCPKCKVPINKDGGCNHMHCKKCDAHFCWVCLGNFDHNSYAHTCNKYKEEEDAKITASRAALKRFVHHSERYMNHVKSRELEAKLNNIIESKMERMQDEAGKTYMDVQFMSDATAQLCEARRILQWTYVLGFYAPKWLDRNIFEMQQSELEALAPPKAAGLFGGVDKTLLCNLVMRCGKRQGKTECLSNMLESDEVLKFCDVDERVRTSRLCQDFDHCCICRQGISNK
jgi:ariadne-1